MPYRDVTLPDGRVVKARISDEAIASWWNQRAHFSGKGHLDRPPDVDTPTLRIWIARPDEAGWAEQAFARNRRAVNNIPNGEFSVYMCNAMAAGSVMKVIVDWRGGVYSVRYKVDVIATGLNIVDKQWSVPADAIPGVQTLINDLLDMMHNTQQDAAQMIGEKPTPWMETDYVDIQANEAEIDLANAESDAEFGSMPKSLVN